MEAILRGGFCFLNIQTCTILPAAVCVFILLSCNVNETRYPTKSYHDLETTAIRLPYVKYYGIDSSLLVYGSNHTNNYADAPINDIENKIHQFKPDVILYEGDGIS